MTPTETPELKPKRNGVIRCTALLGRFPVGVPVLIHDQLNGDGLETHIGIITKCEDPLCLAETYYGKISAIIVTGTLQTNSVTGLEHYSKRISACYWLHLSEADLMSEDFACSWNADEVRERVEYLMASVRPNEPSSATCGADAPQRADCRTAGSQQRVGSRTPEQEPSAARTTDAARSGVVGKDL